VERDFSANRIRVGLLILIPSGSGEAGCVNRRIFLMGAGGRRRVSDARRG